MKPPVVAIEVFLKDVDGSFPIPLSQKQDLHEFAAKLYSKATICVEQSEGNIIAMVAGYTDNLIENRAYISIVATKADFRGYGIASKLLNEFICICQNKRIDAVHLYTASSNASAIKM